MIGSEELFEGLAYLDEDLLMEACEGDFLSAGRPSAIRPIHSAKGDGRLRILLVAATMALLLSAIGLSVLFAADRRDSPTNEVSTKNCGAIGAPDDTAEPEDTVNLPDAVLPSGIKEITWENLDGTLSFQHTNAGAKFDQVWYSTPNYDLPATIPESVFLDGREYGVGERTLVADRGRWQPMVRYSLAGCGVEAVFDGRTGQVIGYIGKELEALGKAPATAGDEAKARELITDMLPEVAIEEYELVQLSVAHGESETIFCRKIGKTATEDRITLSYREGELVGILAENSFAFANFDPALLAGEEARLGKLEDFCRYVCGENRFVSYEITERVLVRTREGEYKLRYAVLLTAEGEAGIGRTKMEVLLDLES